MDLEENKFEICGEKMLNFELKNSCWCPNMDLLGLISSENLFELYRISFKNHKVRSLTSTMGGITSFTFSPDGNHVLLATDKGYFVLLKTESGGGLFNLSLKEHSSEIIHLNW